MRGVVSVIEPTEGQIEIPPKQVPLRIPEIQPTTPTIPDTPTQPKESDRRIVPAKVPDSQSTSELPSNTTVLSPQVPTPPPQAVDTPIQPRRSSRKREMPDKYTYMQIMIIHVCIVFVFEVGRSVEYSYWT